MMDVDELYTVSGNQVDEGFRPPPARYRPNITNDIVMVE
jgi:hypothetical protein